MTDTLSNNLRRLFLLLGALAFISVMAPEDAAARGDHCQPLDTGDTNCVSCDCDEGWFWLCDDPDNPGGEVGCEWN